MAVDEGLKIELGKQGVFVTTIEELYNWGRRNSSGRCSLGPGLLRIEISPPPWRATILARFGGEVSGRRRARPTDRLSPGR